ncbi:MAG: WecB/TagA/CpsF family glycosyltransferase [Chloroflexi bacterium]|nr:WecB/TagA/CpsF family glycosyltransferase [Chloroflexota bacterium]
MTSIIKVNVAPTSFKLASEQVVAWAQNLESRYVCVANVHALMEAHDSPEFMQVLNQADMVTPDGMPLIWMLRLKGHRGQTRVYGPTLMLYVLEKAALENLPVGFYGGKPEILNTLIQKMSAAYPGLQIAYSFSPPYRESDSAEDAKIVERINDSGARILFVGLGCPKQEKWMAAHRGKTNVVMVGVGAAFDFHAGAVAQSPEWMQKIGLEWLFRLMVEPRRLWRRYLYNNPRFIFLAILDLLGLFR